MFLFLGNSLKYQGSIGMIMQLTFKWFRKRKWGRGGERGGVRRKEEKSKREKIKTRKAKFGKGPLGLLLSLLANFL